MIYTTVLLLLLHCWVNVCRAQITYVATLQLPDNLFNYLPSSQNFTGVATTADGLTEFKLQCGGIAPTLCAADSNGLNPSLYFTASTGTTLYNLSTR